MKVVKVISKGFVCLLGLFAVAFGALCIYCHIDELKERGMLSKE